MLYDLQYEIHELVRTKLGRSKFRYSVNQRKNCFGGEYLQIWVACSDININGVDGQKPQIVSLMLDLNTLELNPQVFNCCGGQNIYRKPNMEDPKEKHLAMKSVKITFRKPTPTVEKVKVCILKFIDNYITALKENKEVLKYQDIVNYDELLNSL